MIDYKEYAKQMRENNIAVNGIIQVTEELWLQIADIIDVLAEKQIPKKPLPDNRYFGNGICPMCNAVFMDKLTKYCGNCGQALEWGQEE